MPAYQTDYERFYYNIEHEVNRRCRINIHKRLYNYLHGKYVDLKFYLELKKNRVKWNFEYYVVRRLFPNYYYKLQSEREKENSYEHGCAQYDTPRSDYHYYGEPTNEKISLSQFAYGKIIDQKYKKRFIEAKNPWSFGDTSNIEKEATNYLFEQKMKSSFFLRLIVFLHLN